MPREWADTATPHLITGTDLRPGDVVSSAFAPEPTCLDVFIGCPDAHNAGDDACVSGWLDKVDYSVPHLPELRRKGYGYRPWCTTCWGRQHDDSQQVIRYLAGRVARSRGLPDARAVEADIRGDISVAIWRHNARQLQKCMPGVEPGG